MKITLPFEHRYSVMEVLELPSTEESGTSIVYFPGASTRHGRDGVLLEFIPETRDRWIGCFAFGSSANAVSCVIGSPNPDQACVVSSGAGYIVRVDDPTNWENIRANPVCHVVAIPGADQIVFGDFTKLVAYGPNGLMWESVRLSSDGLDDLQFSANRLSVTGWEAAEGKQTRISLDIADGAVINRRSM